MMLSSPISEPQRHSSTIWIELLPQQYLSSLCINHIVPHLSKRPLTKSPQVDVNTAQAQTTAEMIQAEGHGAALALTCDVTDETAVQAAVDEVVAKHHRIDILVNIVGIGGARGTAVSVNMDEWALGMSINVGSMVIMAKYCIPIMRRNDGSRGYRGAIVNMASVAGIRGGTPHLLYPTSKGAVVNMTRAMASHHAPDGIRVNCVCPGMVYTPMMYGGGMSEEARESRKQRSLLKTEGNGWDVGAAVRFLAGEESRWITGEWRISLFVLGVCEKIACVSVFLLEHMHLEGGFALFESRKTGRKWMADPRLRPMLTGDIGVALPVDAGATCSVGSELPKTASVNP
jgi:NAD(P)-dependent dehydrogenase (short-subunit alcohol dehydrogenase family)